MSVVGAFVLPHPPLAIPEVGRGQERAITSTIEGYREVARRIAELAPQTIVVISPHATMYADYLHISPGKSASGNMSRFDASQIRIDKEYDAEFVEELERLAQAAGIAAGTEGERDRFLDHGTLVPLYFVEEAYGDYQLVRIGLSGLPLLDHYRFGRCIAQAADKLGRRVVIIGSGDLSHRLREDGPYGLDPAGPVFEEKIVADLASAEFGNLLDYDEALCEDAGECGHRSFIEMAGALDCRRVSAQLLSHEYPYGVGYATAIFEVGGPDPERNYEERYQQMRREKVVRTRANEDLFVRLARLSVEAFVTERRVLDVSDDEVRMLLETDEQAAEELLTRRAGAFVSIHKLGRLRGCIGTIGPVEPSLAAEILSNAVSACSTDPRFSPITPSELPDLEINVDVLDDPEPIDSIDDLDVRRYGVIVSSKSGKRGLLLPDLEGVDTPEEQVDIARRKAGIGKFEKFTMKRFEVVRHI